MRLSGRTRKALPWLLLAAAVAATAIVYWPGVTGGWVFDDYPNIVDNAAIHIQPGHATLAAWVNAALSSPASFLHRPLASITFALNWMQGGGNPYPFKVTNIAIHLVNGVLVFLMLRALLRLMALRWSGRAQARSHESSVARTLAGAGRRGAPAPSVPATAPPFIDDSAATRLALIVAAAWMLLPINLMAVLYVVQRMESLCQVFVLAGLWAYLHGRWMMLTAGTRGQDWRGLALAICGIVFGTLVGLTSKETAVLLPLFCFFAEWIVLGFARRPTRQSWIPGSVAGEAGDGPGMTRGKDGTGDGIGMTDREPGKHGPSPGASRHPLPEGEGNSPESAATLREQGPPPGAARHPLPEGEGENRATADWGSQQYTVAEGKGAGQDLRLWAVFTVTLFIPAILGFLWLLRGVLRPAALAGRDFTLGQRLLTEPRVLVDYLHWTLFPNPAVLSLYHDEIKISTGILSPGSTLGAILLLALLIVVAVLLRNRRPLIALGIAWFFGAQLLTATIVPLELVYEQRMYFASIGVLLAVGALLLGVRWRIRLPLLRGFIVGVAMLWFAFATNLRAQEWSNPIRLAVAEADRHPESPRAVYEAGRLLLIQSNYQPGPTMQGSEKYLREASRIPGASTLPDQALIMLVDHDHQGDDAAYWASMVHKLASQPTRQEDISALISLTNCYGAGICRFDVANLDRAYEAALSRPYPIARLNGAYADFQRDILHNDRLAIEYLTRAVKGAPSESAYRMDLAALYARNNEVDKARQQIAALKRMNFAGRLDGQIATLERLVGEAGAASHP